MDVRRAGFNLIMPDGPVQSVVLVLHGGKADSFAPSRPWHLSSVRMRPFTAKLARQGRLRGVAVTQLRYGVRGWNGETMSPVADAAWALQELAEHFGPVPIILLGHSMGARAAAHLAQQEQVSAVVALAPWWPDQDGLWFRRGQKLLVLHGVADGWTDPNESARQVLVAREHGVQARWLPMKGGHFMLRFPGRWHREAVRTVISWADPSQRPSVPNAK